jgi:hypothetical protein
VRQDRVAVIPAAIYVTYTLCGDKELIAQNIRKVKKTEVCSSCKLSRKMPVLFMLRCAKDKPLMPL